MAKTLQEQLQEIKPLILKIQEERRLGRRPLNGSDTEFVSQLLRFKRRIRMVDSGELRQRLRTQVQYRPWDASPDRGGFLVTQAVAVDAFSMNTNPIELLTLCEEMLSEGEDVEKYLIDLFSKAR